MSRSSCEGVAVLVTAALWGTTGTAAALAPYVAPWAIGAAAMGVGGLLQSLIALPVSVPFPRRLAAAATATDEGSERGRS